ncbi:MAG: rubrerythrin family protein [Deltaproteobacteria bacterium]|jgi:rubrerythrin|nr:rubrerythrin family protein [Deltaproteobacteria bacterium]
MTKSLKGSQTEINILTAFAGESQARNRYTMAASVAKNEGYVKVQAIFLETADQECEHAKRLFKFLEGGTAKIGAEFPAGIAGGLPDWLASSAAGENYEWTVMYPEFAKVAKSEGFPAVAAAMESIARAEEFHEKRFLENLKEIKEGTFFKKAKPVQWRCRNCGYIHEGNEPPELCPACAHAKAYFEVLGSL